MSTVDAVTPVSAEVAPTLAIIKDEPITRPRYHRRRYATWGWNTLAMVLAAVLGFPIYWMLITSFKTSSDINALTPQFWPKHPTLRAFTEVVHARGVRGDAGETEGVDRV